MEMRIQALEGNILECGHFQLDFTALISKLVFLEFQCESVNRSNGFLN